MIAMTVADRVGDIPSLTVVLVGSACMSGAVTARWIVDAVRVRWTQLQRLRPAWCRAASVTRAFQVSEETGTRSPGARLIGLFKTFAAVVMGLSSRAGTSFWIPEIVLTATAKHMAMRRGGHLFCALVVATAANDISFG